MNSVTKNLLLYFLAGLGVGVSLGLSLGILEAPDSGERTRRKLAKKAERLKESLSHQFAKS